MLRFIWIVALVFSSLPVLAQGYPDVEAVREVLMAKDLKAVMKHLPVALEKAMSELPPAQRNEYGEMFLIGKSLEREGGKLSSGTSADTFVVFEEPRNGQKVEIVLLKRISDGYDSVLRFGLRREETSMDANGSVEVWLRYEEGEWRIWELTKGMEEVALSEDKFLKKLQYSKRSADESSAVGAMRTYNTALVTYAATYPDVGYPATLDALGPFGEGEEPSPQHCALVDSVLGSPPYEKNGYRFIYRPISSDAYTLIGIPAGERRDGQRSFFTDNSGVIRFTQDDREPNADDPPLQ